MTIHMPEKARSAGRPRSMQLHQAILMATRELVAERGIQGASIEAIAARAGVGKTTIYRRWPSKEAVILEALSELYSQIKIIDTGDLRQDLITLLNGFVHMAEDHPQFERLFMRVFGEARTHPEFFQVLYEQMYAPRLHYLARFIAQAQARGELRQNLDPIFAASLVAGPMLYTLLVTPLLPSPCALHELPEKIVDAILYGVGVN